jgi:hypothetical protein
MRMKANEIGPFALARRLHLFSSRPERIAQVTDG